MESTPVLIDTDMSMDAIMAILYILQRPELSVRAITVAGTGETLGPVECPLARISGNYRYQTIVRTTRFSEAHAHVSARPRAPTCAAIALSRGPGIGSLRITRVTLGAAWS